MKIQLLLLSLLAGATMGAADATQRSEPITMVFSDTDVSQVLKAVGLRTGANIIYVAAKENGGKVPISLNLTVNTPEEAVRSIVVASGLVYRRVSGLYIVASASAMRQALEPYGLPATFSLRSDRANEIAAKLQDALPYATIRATAGKIEMKGISADIRAAGQLVKDFDDLESANASSTDVVVLRTSAASSIVPLVQGLYPGLKVSGTAKSESAATKDEPSAIGMTGPDALVRQARATIQQLDSQSGIGREATVLKICQLKYINGNQVVDLIKQASPGIQVFLGPEAIIPRRATFNPLSATLGTGSGGTSFFGGGGGGSTSTPTSATPGDLPKVGDKATAVVLKGREQDVEDAVKLIEQLDTKPQQVMVEVNVIETSPENAEQIGTQFNWSPLDFFQVKPGSTLTNNPAGSAFTNQITTQPLALGQFSMAPFNFRATVSAMVTKNLAKILAKPSIEVVNNGQGSVFIGNTINTAVTSVGALGANSTTVESFPIGIILLLAPRVNADGNITMHVNPVVSTVTSIDANGLPQTSVREAETTTIVKDGETMVLGGLIQDQDIKTVQSIPFLSQLPLIGQLFSYHSRTHTKNDIVVSITPHLMKETPEPKK